jgi:hypothetical protein
VNANVYIDGFNLYYGALKHRPSSKWLDMGAFARGLLLTGQTLNRIRYFTAPVAVINDPQTPVRQTVFLRALRTVPNLSIHEGQFKVNSVRLPLASNPSRIVEVLKTEEKGSDVNLASYLLLDASKHDADVAIVVSDDFDLQEPLRLARSELGIKVGVVSPRGRTWLRSAVKADFYRAVKPALLGACQFPATLQDAQGQFQRPATWA